MDQRSASAGDTDMVDQSVEDLTRKIAELEKENEYLRSLSLTDALTGIYNYRFFVKQLEVEVGRTKRTGLSCSLMMIDLDNFKLLNDTLGHDEGNKFLIKVGLVIRENLRPTDILCRYAGDEFAIIMPATVLFDGLRIGERLGESVADIRWKLGTSCSVSSGLAEYDPTSDYGASDFVKLADKALYRAKNSGKNSICFEGKLPDMAQVESVTREEKDVLLKREGKKAL